MILLVAFLIVCNFPLLLLSLWSFSYVFPMSGNNQDNFKLHRLSTSRVNATKIYC